VIFKNHEVSKEALENMNKTIVGSLHWALAKNYMWIYLILSR
jgi:uncharacterized membrane protein